MAIQASLSMGQNSMVLFKGTALNLFFSYHYLFEETKVVKALVFLQHLY